MKSKCLNVLLSIFLIFVALINSAITIVFTMYFTKLLEYEQGKGMFEFPQELYDMCHHPLITTGLVISAILLSLGYLFYIINSKLKRNLKVVFMSIIIPLIIFSGILQVLSNLDYDLSSGMLITYRILTLMLFISFIIFISFELTYFKKTPRIAFIITFSLLTIRLTISWMNYNLWQNKRELIHGSEYVINLVKREIAVDVITYLIGLSFIIFAILNITKNKKIQELSD